MDRLFAFEAVPFSDKGSKTVIKMEEKTYKVKRIDGEYAYLEELCSGEELFIAMALLPLGVDIGSVLKFENFEFTEVE